MINFDQTLTGKKYVILLFETWGRNSFSILVLVNLRLLGHF